MRSSIGEEPPLRYLRLTASSAATCVVLWQGGAPNTRSIFVARPAWTFCPHVAECARAGGAMLELNFRLWLQLFSFSFITHPT